MLFNIFIISAIATLGATAALHSWGGERYLLRPLFKYRGNRVLDNHLARLVLRFAWHATSVFWLVLAIILYAAAFQPHALVPTLLGAIGWSFLGVGLFDLVISKGRHIGWPLLTLTGLSTLLALLSF